MQKLVSFLILILTLALPARAHDPLMDLPVPTSVPEAWNVITQSMANIPRCLDTNQLAPITAHVANCSPAIRVLQAQAKQQGDAALNKQLEALFYSGDAIITASRLKEDALENSRAAFALHDAAVKAVMAKFKPEDLTAQVFICPMHPLERSLDPATPCPKCSMKLVRRRIPASTTYEKPGAPSMKLTVKPDAPLKVGQKATITITLSKNDGTPITRRDLLTMHTQKIHLLIVDRSLSDYHHEHPTLTDVPGEYVFSFTPNKPGPHRIFADVVPIETSQQEYVIADIPAETQPTPIEKSPSTTTSEADGFAFTLKMDGKTIANQPIQGWLTITAPDGLPYKQLEPVMGAFAHLVAFNEDGKTVLHIHPEGLEPTNPAERGGPSLPFKLYAPTPGYYRLYAQVQIKGEQKFAPFHLVVEPESSSLK